MYAEKQKRVAFAFGAITLLTLFILVYVFFFYSGLDVEDAKLSAGRLTSTIANPSLHGITEIKAYVEDENGNLHLIAEKDVLWPGKTFPIELSRDFIVNDRIVVVVEAAFNQTLRKTFSISKGFGVKLRPTLNTPSSMFKNQPSTVGLELCNEGIALDAVTIEPSYNEAFFQSNALKESFPLKRSECVSRSYSFVPLQSGLSVITFNINARDFSDALHFSVDVK